MTKEITSNEILFTEKWDMYPQHSLSLHKQSYSDRTCFYSLKDENGFSTLENTSDDLGELLRQLLWEKEVTIANTPQVDNDHITTIHQSCMQWRERVLNQVRHIYWSK